MPACFSLSPLLYHVSTERGVRAPLAFAVHPFEGSLKFEGLAEGTLKFEGASVETRLYSPLLAAGCCSPSHPAPECADSKTQTPKLIVVCSRGGGCSSGVSCSCYTPLIHMLLRVCVCVWTSARQPAFLSVPFFALPCFLSFGYDNETGLPYFATGTTSSSDSHRLALTLTGSHWHT